MNRKDIASTPLQAKRLLDFQILATITPADTWRMIDLIIIVAKIIPYTEPHLFSYSTRAPFGFFGPIVAASQPNKMHSEIS